MVPEGSVGDFMVVSPVEESSMGGVFERLRRGGGGGVLVGGHVVGSGAADDAVD